MVVLRRRNSRSFETIVKSVLSAILFLQRIIFYKNKFSIGAVTQLLKHFKCMAIIHSKKKNVNKIFWK
jgi:hypothetical protein